MRLTNFLVRLARKPLRRRSDRGNRRRADRLATERPRFSTISPSFSAASVAHSAFIPHTLIRPLSGRQCSKQAMDRLATNNHSLSAPFSFYYIVHSASLSNGGCSVLHSHGSLTMDRLEDINLCSILPCPALQIAQISHLQDRRSSSFIHLRSISISH